MSRPRYYWYHIVEKMVKRYPDLKDDCTPQGISYKKAIDAAINETLGMKNGSERLIAVDEIYFRKLRTIDGVALKMNCSSRTVQTWTSDFINTVGRNVGFTTEVQK